MPDAQTSEDGDDARLAALMAWRQELIDSGKVSRTSLKEAHLRQVLRWRETDAETDVEQLRAMLPPSVREHADELARLLTAPPEQAPGGPPRPEHGRHRVPAPPPDPAALADAEDDHERTSMVRPGAPPPAPVRAAETPLTAADFAEFSYGGQQGESLSIAPRRERDPAGRPGALQLSWPPYLPGADTTEAVVLYRLVSSDDGAIYSPDRADLVVATTTATARDERPPRGALRHYQVWVNVGATRSAALAAQPVRHADTVLVSPVQDFQIREDNGQVIGQWSVPDAVRTVYVSRVPAAERDRVGLQHRILTDRDNLTGFVDAGADRGERYRYVVRAAAAVDGVLRLSESTEADVDVTAVLAPVTDLSITTQPDGVMADLTWTKPPAGRVVIYRTQHGPNAGADATELPEAALEQIGLAPTARLTQPDATRTDPDGVTRTMLAGVSWPQEWSRAYLTPVTLLAGRALLGKTLSSVRTGLIRDVDLAEYCNKQVVTFDWPSGAAAVEMHVAPRGYDPRNGLTGKSKEISRENYDRYGGLQLSQRELPIAGCSLHLAPVAFSGGRKVVGAVRSVEYPGLLRVQYAIRLGHDPEGWPAYAHIALRAEVDVPGSPAFVLVHNRDRIPLSANDGDAVDAAPLNADGQLGDQPSKEMRWSQLTTHGAGEIWAANLRERRGWIRLFVSTTSPERLRTIALLDPPVDTLHLAQVPQ
jgi:hypothetical protein